MSPVALCGDLHLNHSSLCWQKNNSSCLQGLCGWFPCKVCPLQHSYQVYTHCSHTPACTCCLPCAAHMFDRTSVIMLCMMTIAFLIPCVLSYVPALRMLQGPGFSSMTPRPSSSFDLRGSYSPTTTAAAGSGGTWASYSTGSSYTGAIPPRPAARVRPGSSSISPAS